MAKSETTDVGRTGEFVLGLLGGIFGFFGGLFALIIGGASKGLENAGFGASGGETVIGLGWIAILASIVAIVAAVLVRSRAKMSGWVLIICGIAGLIAVSVFYLLPAVLLLIAGLMALLRHGKARN